MGELWGSGGIGGRSLLHWSHALLAQTGSMSHPLEQTTGEFPASGMALTWLPGWVLFCKDCRMLGKHPRRRFFFLELCRAECLTPLTHPWRWADVPAGGSTSVPWAAALPGSPVLQPPMNCSYRGATRAGAAAWTYMRKSSQRGFGPRPYQNSSSVLLVDSNSTFASYRKVCLPGDIGEGSSAFTLKVDKLNHIKRAYGELKPL